MTVFNSSVFVSSNQPVFQLHVRVQSWLVTSELQLDDCSVHNLKTDCESILLELSKRVLKLGHRVAWVGVFAMAILGMERHFCDIRSRLFQTELEICLPVHSAAL